MDTLKALAHTALEVMLWTIALSKSQILVEHISQKLVWLVNHDGYFLNSLYIGNCYFTRIYAISTRFLTTWTVSGSHNHVTTSVAVIPSEQVIFKLVSPSQPLAPWLSPINTLRVWDKEIVPHQPLLSIPIVIIFCSHI